MSLLDKLVGPTEEEYISNFAGRPYELFAASLRDCFYMGVENAIIEGADVTEININLIHSFILNHFSLSDIKDFFFEIHNTKSTEIPQIMHQNVSILLLLYNNGLNLSEISHSFILFYNTERGLANEIIPYWFQFTSMVDLKDNEKDELFIIAAENNNIPILIELYNIINVDLKERAFNQAALNGHLSVVEYLFSMGVDIHNHFELALSQAGRSVQNRGHVEVIDFLLQHQADFDLAYKYHRTLWDNIINDEIYAVIKKYLEERINSILMNLNIDSNNEIDND